MIPGPATFLPLMRAAIHLGVALYFLSCTLRKSGAGPKVVFCFCALAMLAFAYDDWIDFRTIVQS